jgi:hypothetical protein
MIRSLNFSRNTIQTNGRKLENALRDGFLFSLKLNDLRSLSRKFKYERVRCSLELSYLFFVLTGIKIGFV